MTHTVLYPLPIKIKALCCEDAEGYQTIVLNSRYTHEANIASYLHEASHRDDFGQELDVGSLESDRHKT